MQAVRPVLPALPVPKFDSATRQLFTKAKLPRAVERLYVAAVQRLAQHVTSVNGTGGPVKQNELTASSDFAFT